MSKDESKDDKKTWTPKYYRRYGRLVSKDHKRVITIHDLKGTKPKNKNKSNEVFFKFSELEKIKKTDVCLFHFEGKKVIIRAEGKWYDGWYLSVSGPKKSLVIKPVTNDSWSRDNDGHIFVISSKHPLAIYTKKGKNENRLYCHAGKKFWRCGAESKDWEAIEVKKQMDFQQLGLRHGEKDGEKGNECPQATFFHWQYQKYWAPTKNYSAMKEALKKAGDKWKNFPKWLESETNKGTITQDTYWKKVKEEWDKNKEKVERIKACMDKAAAARKYLAENLPDKKKEIEIKEKQDKELKRCKKAYESAEKGYDLALEASNQEYEKLVKYKDSLGSKVQS